MKQKPKMMPVTTAALVCNALNTERVILPMNKVIVAIYSGEEKIGSIIVPHDVDVTDLKKGVVVSVGKFEENPMGGESIEVGDIITFGDYAGKKVYIENDIPALDNYNIHVLSTHEIVMLEKRS